MIATFHVLAASLLLGQAQAPDAPALSPPVAGAKTYIYSGGVLVPYNDAQRAATSSSAAGATSAASNRPILSKIQSWFGKRGSDGTAPPGAISGTDTTTRIIAAPIMPPAQGSTPVTAPATAPADFPKKMPAISSQLITPKHEVLVLPAKDGVAVRPVDAVSTVSLKPAPAAKSPIRPAVMEKIGRDEKFEWVTGQLAMENGHYVLYYATPETVDTYHGRVVLNPAKVDMKAFRSGDLVSARGQLHVGRGAPVYQLTSADLIERAKQ